MPANTWAGPPASARGWTGAPSRCASTPPPAQPGPAGLQKPSSHTAAEAVNLITCGNKVLDVLNDVSIAFFKVVAIVMKAAPIGAFGAMAFTIGKYGIATLFSLAALVGTFYLTALLFVVVVLGLVARVCGFSIFKLISYLKAELLLVLGTSSSESALPSLIETMERAGAPTWTVGLVVPTGY